MFNRPVDFAETLSNVLQSKDNNLALVSKNAFLGTILKLLARVYSGQ